jgi:hypothetical protein
VKEDEPRKRAAGRGMGVRYDCCQYMVLLLLPVARSMEGVQGGYCGPALHVSATVGKTQ